MSTTLTKCSSQCVLTDNTDVGELGTTTSLAIVAEVANDASFDGVSRDDVRFRTTECGGKADFGTMQIKR